MTATDFEVLLPGDELDGTLRTLLEPIGEAIAKSIQGARVRVAEFERRYGGEEYGREVAHPIMRHQDRSMYFREHADCYGLGSYRHEPLPVDPDALPHPAVMPFTPEHFGAAQAAAIDLLPALRGTELPYRINGLFSFTADGFPLLGEATGVHGLWVAEAIWISHAGGAGEAIAAWMAEGDPGPTCTSAT